MSKLKRKLNGKHTLLRVFIGESDQFQHKALYVEILERARKRELAGCTVLRGIAGFGGCSIVHEDHPLRLSSDLPIVIELVDTQENVEKFIQEIDPLLKGALITEENVHVHQYSAKKE